MDEIKDPEVTVEEPVMEEGEVVAAPAVEADGEAAPAGNDEVTA